MAKNNTDNLSLSDKLGWISNKYKTDLKVDFLDTGSIILNMLFGGGLPMTKNIQIYSESGYGKSTISATICKSLCKQGYRIIYVDAEGSLNENFLRTMNILTDDENNLLYDAVSNPDGPFLVVQTSYFEDIEELLETAIPKYDSNGNPCDSDFKLVVIDSVAALAPKEYRGDSGEKLSVTSNKPGIIAKDLSAFLRKFNGYKTAYNMSFLYINQVREDLSFGYGHQDVTPGGKAMKFYTDVLIKLTHKGYFKKEVLLQTGEKQEVITEREIGITCVKNKITDGQITLPLQVVFGRGISNIAAMPKILRTKKITNDKGELVPMIEGTGSWMTLNIIKEVVNDKNETEQIPTSIRVNGIPKLKEAIRKNFKDIVKVISEEDFKILEEDQTNGEL